MFGKICNVAIRGMKSVVPDQKVDNYSLISEMSDEKKLRRQIKMIGIKERCVAPEGVTSEQLCTQAAEQLIQELGWNRDTIRVMLYVTETPNFVLPSTAFMIQKRLGIGPDCMVYDINLGCSGWIAGMQTIGSIMMSVERTDTPIRALLLAGSISTSHLSAEDVSSFMLFGDAGTATALEFSNEASDICYMQQSDGTGYKHIFMENINARVRLDGAEVFDFTINQVVDSIRDYMKHYGIVRSEIDYYVFHQAQKFIIDNMVSLLECQEGKVLSSFQTFGNTAAAAIPLTMCYNCEILGKQEQVQILAAGFGAGLSWGAMKMNLETQNILGVSILKGGSND